MIDDKTKLLAKRIEQERPVAFQIALWIDELIKLRLQEEWLSSDRLTKEIEVMQANNQGVMHWIHEIALAHPECDGCKQIHNMMITGIASYVLIPPVAAVAAPND